MINKYFNDEEIQENDLFFMCSMIERCARKIHQKNKYVVNQIQYDELYHLISLANVLHCENPNRICDEWIKEYQLQSGNFFIENVDKELCTIIPTANDMGKLYTRLILDTTLSNEDYIEGIIRVYNNPICKPIDTYNNGAFFEPPITSQERIKKVNSKPLEEKILTIQ